MYGALYGLCSGKTCSPEKSARYRALWDGLPIPPAPPEPVPACQRKAAAIRPKGKPGGVLKAIFASLGIDPTVSCNCEATVEWMDSIGVEGCKNNKEEIVKRLREGAKKYGWLDKLNAARKAVATGLVFKLDWLDPFAGLVDEAIRRADDAASI
jgi:hypothetical protein